jgi:hypothetical protein
MLWLQARALKFAEWLVRRPEQSIAVVSHCEFLKALFTVLARGLSLQVCLLLCLMLRIFVMSMGICAAHMTAMTHGTLLMRDLGLHNDKALV